MSTEENHPSLYSALYEALSDHRLIGKLLQHPEFRHRAGKICRGIAGPVGGEDLFQTVCQRMLVDAAQLNPRNIRGEGEFFNWFTQLARHVHLGNLLAVEAADICMDGTGRWPDDPADVPPDDVGRFLSHADACPYHTRILRAEEESLRASFSRARGLDSQGRILLGDEFDESVAEHRRRLQSWREAGRREGEPFGHVSLYNGGREVASCGKFYDFSIHKSKNKLDPRAGLQIYGVSSAKPDENVLLGFYALEGVRHEGKELTFGLDNGYTIGLAVKQLGESTFDIHFRCVETESLALPVDPFVIDGDTDVITVEMPEDVRREGSPVYPAIPVSATPESSGWWARLQSSHAAAYLTASLLVALSCFLLGWAQGRAGALMAGALGGHASTAEVRVVPPGQGQGTVPQPPTQAGARTTPIPLVQTSVETREEMPTHAAGGSRPRGSGPPASVARLPQGPGQKAKAQPEARTRSGDGRRVSGDEDFKAFVMGALPGSANTVTQGISPNEVSNLQLLSQEQSNGSSALHITTDPLLGEQLPGALQRESLLVKNVDGQSPKDPRVIVRWDAKAEPTASAKPFVVIVKTNINRGSENFFPQLPSYKGEGHTLKGAYKDAIEKAVPPVVEKLKAENERERSASEPVPARVEPQPLFAMPEETQCAF